MRPKTLVRSHAAFSHGSHSICHYAEIAFYFVCSLSLPVLLFADWAPRSRFVLLARALMKTLLSMLARRLARPVTMTFIEVTPSQLTRNWKEARKQQSGAVRVAMVPAPIM